MVDIIHPCGCSTDGDICRIHKKTFGFKLLFKFWKLRLYYIG